MIELNGAVVSSLTFLSGSLSDWRLQQQLIQSQKFAPLEISVETRAQFLKCFEVLAKAAKELDAISAGVAAQRAFDECLALLSAPIGYDAHRLGKVIGHAERVLVPFMDELAGRQVFALSQRQSTLFAAGMPFGDAVNTAFPSVTYDAVEAGKCLALGRWTASVMHIMRVLEVGLRALATLYGLEAEDNWNKVLNQIEAKTREVGKRTYGADQEQWAAEAALHLRFIKNAWRNRAMHPLQKYDEEQATAIYDNTRSFMRHLAEKLTEVNTDGV
jgi:tRNA nucleotidyltransferase/poly(A) polymerase